MSWPLSSRVDLGRTIKPADAERQRTTAEEILRRFDDRPGVILADEVGMGKTFVALAVAVSVLEATDLRRPVVVMVPPSVQGKWPREWMRFAEGLGSGPKIRAAEQSVVSASDFLKLLDDPEDRRAHVIFLTHGALHNALGDPLLKLFIMHRALSVPWLSRQREVFPRWAERVIRGLRLGPRDCAELLRTPHNRWRRKLEVLTGRDPGDDPIPELLAESIGNVDLTPLREALAGELPLRDSRTLDDRLACLRRSVTGEVAEVWRRCITAMDLHLPLLILDEAHHAKNSGTRLAGLFANERARQDLEATRGALGGVFDRMLFLTATPFQLGHDELIEVLRRFTGVRWDDLDRESYERELQELKAALDAMRASGLRLDRAWGRLGIEDLASCAALPPGWWGVPGADGLPPQYEGVAATWCETRERTRAAEHAIRPFVIRHLRPDRDARRDVRCGAAIASGNTRTREGLQIADAAVLPFLLAARAQALVSIHGLRAHERSRALFADGLASSFEAYRYTRGGPADGMDEVEIGVQHDLPQAIAWYLDRIERALPDQGTDAMLSHPKIAATVDRAVQLWLEREKVVVFCFYRATGRALRSHISRALERETDRLAAEQMGLNPDDRVEVHRRIDLVRDRLFDPQSPSRRYAENQLRDLLSESLSGPLLEEAADLSLRFLRTRSFLVRYGNLGGDANTVMSEAFERSDASGLRFSDVVRSFGKFIAAQEETEKDQYLKVLRQIEVGDIRVHDDEVKDDNAGLLANVRLANGSVAQHLRERLMIAFNTPFFPEILIASAVMAEGVDLHRDCRFVIHHDLDWNPSVIEQRTGRLDRIDSKGEVTGLPVVVYEPFIEGAQDEKQFRVMKDRERWFNIVLGERVTLDEWATDQIARRVELPLAAAAELTMDLSVAGRLV